MRAKLRAGGRVLGGFMLLFLAVWVLTIILGVGINFLMRWLGVGENLRVFLGVTINRGGLLVGTVALSSVAMRKILHLPGLEALYPRSANGAKDFLAGILLSVLAMALVFWIEVQLGWLEVTGWALRSQAPDAVLRTAWVCLLANALAAFGEEAMFRGYLLAGLQRTWGTGPALLVMSALFGLAHILVQGADETAWALFIVLLALPGVMLAYAALRTGNLWLAAGIHFAWNLFQDDVFNLTGEAGNQNLVGLFTRQTGPSWFVGTSYGIEVGAAGLVCLGLVSVGSWWWTRQAARRPVIEAI